MSTELTVKEQRIADALALLTNKERAAYKFFLDSLENKSATEIPTNKLEPLYSLFKSGKSCEEIRRLYHPDYSLGQIVCARVTDKWDSRFEEYTTELVPKMQEQVVMTQVESASFIADMITACHRIYGDAIKRYIATGDKTHLKDTPLDGMSMKQYSQLLSLLMTVTGQDNSKTVNVKTSIEVKKPDFSGTSASELLNSLVPDK